jgi:XRE family transcriptional regulator, regulator of sulfur utilization
MRISRRDLNLLLPMLAAAGARAQEPAAPVETMTSKAYPNDRIPYKGDENKKARRFFLSQTHGGFKVEMHETNLGPGIEAHPPHQHVHEEIMVVTAGSLEANMDGVKTTVPAGSVLVFGSNKPHNVRNPGTVTAKYYVIELRGTEA